MLTCQFEDGGKASLRHVVVDCIIVKNQKVLLTKRAPHLTNPNKWTLPGGFLDRNETTREATRREALEETGYKVKIDYLFQIIDNPNRPREDRQNVSFIYVATALEKKGNADKESIDTKWFDLFDLPNEEEFAFDHYENLKLYEKHLKQAFKLPLIR